MTTDSQQRRGYRPGSKVGLVGNLLLDALPEDERITLIQDASERELGTGEILFEPGRRMGTVFFPTTAVASMCILTEAGTWLGTGVSGSEGFIGLSVFLGSGTTPNRMGMVLIPGRALAVGADAFLAQVDASPKLSELLRRFTQTFITQLAQAVLCEHEHRVEERTARWLLMLRDRVPGDTLPLTHESLARMVGARRQSVTEAIGELDRRGAIRHSRGHITLVDRDQVAEAACECYEVTREDLRQLLPLS